MGLLLFSSIDSLLLIPYAMWLTATLTNTDFIVEELFYFYII